MQRKTVFEAIGAAVLLAVFFILALTATSTRSVTAPEVVHLPAGQAYAASGGDPRFLDLAPPLVGGLAGLLVAGSVPAEDPVAMLDAKEQDVAGGAGAGEAGGRIGAAVPAEPAVASAVRYGRAWFAGIDPPLQDMMARARLPVLVLGALLGLFIFLLTRSLFGGPAGLLALALFAFSPDFLGWSGLVAPAVPAAALAVGAHYVLLRYARTGKLRFVLLAGLGLGLAMAADFAALLYVPVLGVTLALVGAPPDSPRRPWWRSNLGPAVLLAATALVAATLLTAGHLDVLFRGVARTWSGPHPETPVYLTGAWNTGGFLRYFLVFLATKTPVSTLVLVAAGAAAVLLGRAGQLSLRLTLLLASPVVGYLLLAALAGRDTCRSFLYPALAVLFVLGGGLLAHARFRAWLPRTLVALVAALALVSAWTGRSHYLAYFNSVSGGLLGGPGLVSDSCIDVGQDLGALADYCRQNQIHSVGVIPGAEALAPRAYGIAARAVSADEALVPEDGWYAVGASALHGRHSWTVGPISLDWFSEFKPVAVLGGSVYVYRFLRTSEARSHVPAGFQGEVLPAEAMTRRRLKKLETLHAAYPENGWIAGRLGEMLALQDQSNRALELLATARADLRPELDTDRKRWALVAAWQNAALGRLDRALEMLGPLCVEDARVAGGPWVPWARTTKRYLEETRHALRETRRDPPRQQEALARVRRLNGRLRRALAPRPPDEPVPEPAAQDRPGIQEARAALADHCRKRRVTSMGVLPHDPDGRFRDAGVPARPMQPEEVLEPVGPYAIHESVLGQAGLWPGCQVVLDWDKRFQTVARFGPWQVYEFVTLHERRVEPPPGFPGTIRRLEDVARDARAILEASLVRAPRDPWCRAELAVRNHDLQGLVDALGDHTFRDLRYRLRWLSAAAALVLGRGELDLTNRLLGEIRIRKKIKHQWLDHVQGDLNALRQELARGLSSRDPGPLNRVRRITNQLQLSLNLVFSLPERAHRLYQEGRAEEAAALNEFVVSRAPNPDWLFDAGILAFRGWQVDQAVRHLERAEQAGVKIAAIFLIRALAFRGYLRTNPHDLDRARAAYDRARAGNLDVTESFEELVEPYRQIASDLRRAMSLDPVYLPAEAGSGTGEPAKRDQ